MKKSHQTFYTSRDLCIPKHEHWIESSDNLEELIKENKTYIALGNGNHIYKKRIKENSEVLRFEKLSGVLQFDKVNMVTRVSAGTSWAAFKEIAKERGFSTFPFRLYQNTSTIGGLLSRRTRNHPSLWDGSLRGYCHAIRAMSHLGEYRYLNAPRKAAGPDLRSLWFGAAGEYGFIVDASIGLFPRQEMLIVNWHGNSEAPESKELFSNLHRLEKMGARTAWSHGEIGTKKTSLSVAFTGSKNRLDVILEEAKKLSSSASFDFIVGSQCEEIREELEQEDWKLRSEAFLTRDAFAKLKRARFVNASLHGFTILSKHRLPEQKSKWSKKLNTLTKTRDFT